MKSLIDLHTHSTISDGSDTPTQLVDLAAAAGCTLIALTDHDTTDGLAEAQARGVEVGVEVMAGIELSAHTSRRSAHILGYFNDFDDAILQSLLRSQRELRHQRNERLLNHLNEEGLSITMDDVRHYGTGSSIGRPHFAAALVARGFVSTINEAFRRFLSDKTNRNVEQQGLPAAEAIAWIRDAGGVAVWAHPFTPPKFGLQDLTPDIEEMKEAGLAGMECWYGAYEPKLRRRLAKQADKHSLLATGGSDYHGTYKVGLEIGIGRGDLEISSAIAVDLKQLLSK